VVSIFLRRQASRWASPSWCYPVRAGEFLTQQLLFLQATVIPRSRSRLTTTKTFRRRCSTVLALGPGTTPADAAWSIGGNPIPPFPSQFDFAKIAEALGKAGQVEIHVFPDAGHLLVAVGRGNAVSSFSYSSSLKGYMSTGGTANGNCEASFDAFGQMLRFLNSLNAVTRPRR
jgi:hypothetical protein